MQLLDGTPFSYNNIANSGERVQFKNRVYVYDCCCRSSVGVSGQGCLEGVRAMKSLNHFRTEVIGKHPAEGWCRKCNTPCLKMQVQHLCQHGRMCSERKVKDYVDATARGKRSKTRYRE